MSIALTYENTTRTTCAYLGYQSNVGTSNEKSQATPGDLLLRLLLSSVNKADHPLLLPAFASGLWVDHLQHGNHGSARALRQIQSDIGLMDPYLKKSKSGPKKPSPDKVRQLIDLNSIHSKIVLEHGYLTNGVSEFLTSLFPSTREALAVFSALRLPQSHHPSQQSVAFQIKGELEEYVEHMAIRAQAELQHRDRMLSRMNVYFQVVS